MRDYPLYNPDLFDVERARTTKFRSLALIADSFEQCIENLRDIFDRDQFMASRLLPVSMAVAHGLPIEQLQLLLTVCAEELRKNMLRYVNVTDEGAEQAATLGSLLLNEFKEEDRHHRSQRGNIRRLIGKVMERDDIFHGMRDNDVPSSRELLYLAVVLPIIMGNLQPDELQKCVTGRFSRSIVMKVRGLLFRDCLPVGSHTLAPPAQISVQVSNMTSRLYAMRYFSTILDTPAFISDISSADTTFALAGLLSGIAQMHAVACAPNPSHIHKRFLDWYIKHALFRGCVPTREEIDEFVLNAVCV